MAGDEVKDIRPAVEVDMPLAAGVGKPHVAVGGRLQVAGVGNHWMAEGDTQVEEGNHQAVVGGSQAGVGSQRVLEGIQADLVDNQ